MLKAFDPNRSGGQHWEIAIGPHAAKGLGHDEAQVCRVHAWTSGPKLGQIELDDPRRVPITLNPAQAEKLAREYDHESDPGEQRVEAALLDAAHLARQALSITTSRRKPGRL